MIYTAGYAGHSISDLQSAAPNALVVDIRFRPVSRQPEWRQDALQRVLGTGYIHAKGFGNAEYATGGMRLHDPEAAWDMLQHSIHAAPIVLLCACRSPNACHRTVVAQWLRSKGYEVRELEW